MLYSATFLRFIVRQGSLSDSSEELFQTREELGYSGAFANYKRQTSQVNDFSAFLCLGR